eukprot:2417339-Pleurochrysis_carterae.AAC.3
MDTVLSLYKPPHHHDFEIATPAGGANFKGRRRSPYADLDPWELPFIEVVGIALQQTPCCAKSCFYVPVPALQYKIKYMGKDMRSLVRNSLHEIDSVIDCRAVIEESFGGTDAATCVEDDAL